MTMILSIDQNTRQFSQSITIVHLNYHQSIIIYPFSTLMPDHDNGRFIIGFPALISTIIIQKVSITVTIP